MWWVFYQWPENRHGSPLAPLWIFDEAQNLPAEFFRDFPSFLNFAFDSRDLMSVRSGRWGIRH